MDASATGENSFSACVKEGVETNKDRLNACCIFCTILHHTVDGHNPAPVDMKNNGQLFIFNDLHHFISYFYHILSIASGA